MSTPKGLTKWLAFGSPPDPAVEQLRRDLMDRVFRPFVLTGLVALGLGAWRAIEDGQWSFGVVYLGLYLSGVAIAAVAKRMSLGARSWIMVATLFLIALAGLLRLGLSGIGVIILVVACGLCGILQGARAALWAIALGVAIIGAVGYTMVQGLVVVAPERANTSLSAGAWVMTAATFAAITAGLIIPLQALSARFAESLQRLRCETARTERSNRKLRAAIRRRQQAEQALRASELRYRRIFESASVGIMEEDVSRVRAVIESLRAEGVTDFRAYLADHPELVDRAAALVRIRDVNQAAFETYGAQSKEELLASLDQILVPESRDTFREVLIALAEGSARFRGESVNRTLGGSRIHVLLQASIPEDPNANVLLSVLDVTERKLLEQSLAEAKKMEAIGTLAGGIAHDFNNLLMGIRGYATLVRYRSSDRSEIFGYLDSIDQLVDSGAGLTGQLLGFARGGRYDLQTTDLQKLLDASLAIFGRAKKEIEIDKDFEPKLWTVDVDRNQLEQVMLNLYVNAWQAMPDGGELHVAAANLSLDDEAGGLLALPAGDYVRVAVRDTGVGMDEATRARVFEPFFTTKELGRGTGLGLASAYAIVRNHGGAFEVRSKVGEGSTFVLYLPASKKPVATRESLVPTIERGHETILLVDDEPSLRRSTGLMLEELGYRVFTAADGREAIERFRENESAVSAVILDMIMPGLGGGETFASLREQAPSLPILLSSGYSQDARANALLSVGPTAFLQKPFRLEELSKKLRELLAKGSPGA